MGQFNDNHFYDNTFWVSISSSSPNVRKSLIRLVASETRIGEWRLGRESSLGVGLHLFDGGDHGLTESAIHAS